MADITRPIVNGEKLGAINDSDILEPMRLAGELAQRDQLQGRAPNANDRKASQCRVKNISGATVGRYEILGIDQPLFQVQNSDRIHYTGKTPAESHKGRFVVLQRQCQNNDSVIAIVDGVTQANVDVIETDHRFADVKVGSTTELESGETGSAQIITPETFSVTGPQWCTVRLTAPAADSGGSPYDGVPASGTFSGFMTAGVLHDLTLSVPDVAYEDDTRLVWVDTATDEFVTTDPNFEYAISCDVSFNVQSQFPVADTIGRFVVYCLNATGHTSASNWVTFPANTSSGSSSLNVSYITRFSGQGRFKFEVQYTGTITNIGIFSSRINVLPISRSV